MFFDEINTNDNINGLLKEIVVDKCLEGKKISKYVTILAACNPYKLKKTVTETFTNGLKNKSLED